MYDVIDWIMEHFMIPALAILSIVATAGLIVGGVWFGWHSWAHRNDPDDPWTCMAEHFDHFQPVWTGKIMTQTPVYVCSIHARRADDWSVTLSDGTREITIRAPFKSVSEGARDE